MRGILGEVVKRWRNDLLISRGSLQQINAKCRHNVVKILNLAGHDKVAVVDAYEEA